MKSPVTWLIVLVVVLVGALGYTAGKQGFVLNNPLETPQPSPSAEPLASDPVACTQEAKLCPDGSYVSRIPPTCDFAPCPSPVPQIIQGGGILSFPEYQVTIPPNWTYAKISNSPDNQTLKLEHGDYVITVSEGAFGGNVCLYPGDPPFEGPSQTYSTFAELTTIDGLQLRRSSTGLSGFTVCQFTHDSWQAPTPYGHMSIQAPATPTTQDLATLDTILQSFKKL